LRQSGIARSEERPFSQSSISFLHSLHWSPIMSYQHIKVPTGGEKITVNADFSLNVSDQRSSRLSKATARVSTSRP
jgi:hypothetical protein